MSKYKIGDRVEALESRSGLCRAGEKGQIIRYCSGVPIVKFDGRRMELLVSQLKLKKLENITQSKTIDEQTIMFWNLQLQFMARSSDSLLDVYEGLRFGGMYKNNKYTQKMEQLRHRYGQLFTEEEHNCLATHLALQLSGVE